MGRWEHIQSQYAVQCDIWDRNTFGFVSSSKEIFCWANGQWMKQPGAAKHLSIGSGGYQKTTCCNHSQEIFYSAPAQHHQGGMNNNSMGMGGMNSYTPPPQPMNNSMGMGGMGGMNNSHPHPSPPPINPSPPSHGNPSYPSQYGPTPSYSQPPYNPNPYNQPYQSPQPSINISLGPTGMSMTQSGMQQAITCPSCCGKSGLGTFGYCNQGDIHYKRACNTCNGSAMVRGFPQRCPACQGKGSMGTFGPCTPWDIHAKGPCVSCAGRGFQGI